MTGGSGHDALLGGEGDDKLKGNDGRDLLIGGVGKDDLNGGKGDDLLISGWTAYDDDIQSIEKIMTEWVSEEQLRHACRESAIQSVVSLQASGPGQSVFNDDDEKDKLKGDKDRDWFFSEIGRDKLKDLKGNEDLN